MTKTTRLKGPVATALGLATALMLGACSSTDSPPPTSPSAPAPPPLPVSAAPSTPGSVAPTSTGGRRIGITVKGKEVTPAPATVSLGVGEALTIAVTSDKANTLHAHGFEIAKDLLAGQQGEVTIKGAQPGVYEFELHDPELLLFRLAVR